MTINPTWPDPLVVVRRLENPPVSRIITSQDHVPIGMAGASTYVCVIWRGAEKKDANTLRAKKFKDLVKNEGKTPTQAAKEVKTTLETLTRRELYAKDVQQTLDDYGWLPPEVKREHVRAKQMKWMDIADKAIDASPLDAKTLPNLLKVAVDLSKTVGYDKDIQLFEVTKPAALPPAELKQIEPPETPAPVLPPAIAEFLEKEEKKDGTKEESS